LHTANKKICLVPAVFRNDIPRLAAGLASPPPPPETLLLIGRRDLRSNNSWMHNSTRLVKGPERCTLRMHPTDATPRGIKHGEKARIQSATGTIEATAELSDEIMPGVVSLPHGWGHHRSGTQWRVAEAHAGVSLNDITDDQLVDDLTGNAAFSGVPVQVAGATTSSESPPLAPS
jgi:anaerobic selenocysteine-containing dehydrogenase